MMSNDVGGAKLGVVPDCSLDQVEYMEDVTHYFRIDEEGEPTYEIDHTDGDFVAYVCRGCENEFEDFDKVKEHLNE